MMQKRTPGDLVQLATRIPQRLHRAARLRAVEEERPLGTLVAEALSEHLVRCQAAQPLRAVRDADRNAPRSRGSGAASATMRGE
jgi:hypothetical protein